jgi:hypothetical protein
MGKESKKNNTTRMCREKKRPGKSDKARCRGEERRRKRSPTGKSVTKV